RSSTNLAAAYGIAVTMTMLITTLLAFVVAWRRWKWPLWVAVSVTVLFLIVDLAFFGANIVKIHQGGWFPIVVGAAVYLLMSTWKRGRDILTERLQRDAFPFAQFVATVRPDSPPRVSGTAVFMQYPGVPDVLYSLRAKGLDLDLMRTSFFLSRETLIPSKRPGMVLWRE